MSALPPGMENAFPRTWSAKLLSQPPLIAPARQFTYPLPVPGEEDALARGAVQLEVKPATSGTFLATCALGFRDPSLPSGVSACPRPDDLLAVAGGYAYLADTLHPEHCLHLPLRPAVAVVAAPEDGLLLLAGFHHIIAVGAEGLRWESARLSWEGIQLGDLSAGQLHGTGWDMRTDRELPFTLNLKTGQHTGGAFNP